MANFIPITLLGNNLRERHRHLNKLVKDAFESPVPFETIRDLPERSPVDRLFKIDLASKHKNVNYIIDNLKDTDMLYVTRALKCTWLLQEVYKDVINADYLDDVLFPEMTTTAVNKMQHWLQHHLRDPERCLEFYKKYKESEFNLAIKFLWHCSNDYILEEFANIVTKIEPQNLRILSEKCPQLTRIFYERIELDSEVTNNYLSNEVRFFNNLKFILKPDPDTFFYVTEKYFNRHRFESFSSDITKHIMIKHKIRFLSKPELYTSQLLDVQTLAKYLGPGEIKELILKLAKAEYLEYWFTYKAVEPLIKRLENKERVELKKQVFVDKNIGTKTKEWPYTTPDSPTLKKKPSYSLFSDKEQQFDDIYYALDAECEAMCYRSGNLKCRKLMCLEKSLLDTLFDNYRFSTFETTLFELRKRLKTESSPQNRQYMMLVLVSKTGGNEAKLRSLFELLLQYRNEPVHWRAAIVRSLVKRAFAWRLPKDLWGTLLEWAHGLGLDGSTPEAACDEGLHAVVLRNLLDDEIPNNNVLKAFFNHFSHYDAYTLNSTEKNLVRSRLPNLLLNTAKTEDKTGKLQRLEQLLDTLLAYKIKFDDFPEVINVIAGAVREFPEGSEFILHRLYGARVARKQLFRENFFLFQNNTSYSNALRHDTSIFDMDKFQKIIENERRLPFDQFLRKLAVYFCESGGLVEQFYAVFKSQAETEPHKYLARPLAYLAGDNLVSLLTKYDVGVWRSPVTKQQRLAAELRANAHRSKPQFDLDKFGWNAAGTKAIANFVSVSARNKRDDIINKLMESRRTLRLALALAKKNDIRLSIYKTFVKLRPGTALTYFLRNLKKEECGCSFIAIWETLKHLITELDYSNRRRLFENLSRVETVPRVIKAEFFVLVYQAYLKNNKEEADALLCYVENMIYEVEETFLNEIINNFLKNDFVDGKLPLRGYDSYYFNIRSRAFTRIIAKFLLLCKSEEVQRERIDCIGELFFGRIEQFWKDSVKKEYLITLLNEFLLALKYNKVFFDLKFISCMPVFERVVSWLHKMLPIEKYFDVYTNIHLTMLYYKTARYCVNEKSGFFTGDSENIEKGIEMFGDVFGKFITQEYEQLRSNYFQSMREIYGNELMSYFESNLDYANFDESKEKFIITLVKSILSEEEANEAHFVASSLFDDHKRYFAYGYDLSGIHNLLKETKNKELSLWLTLPKV